MPFLSQGLVKSLGKLGPVGKSGKWVVMGHKGDFFISFPFLSHVLNDGNEILRLAVAIAYHKPGRRNYSRPTRWRLYGQLIRDRSLI